MILIDWLTCLKRRKKDISRVKAVGWVLIKKFKIDIFVWNQSIYIPLIDWAQINLWQKFAPMNLTRLVHLLLQVAIF